MKNCFLAALIAATNFTAAQSQPLSATSGQAVPQLSPDNIEQVVQAMTLDEKARLLVGGSNNFFGDQAVVGSEATLVPGAAGTTAPIERLGIPATVLTDGPAGVRIDATRPGDSRSYYATGFPIGTCLAATWNTDIVTLVGRDIGNETKEYRCDVILGPGMNLHRNPLCGRNFEYYSEDPLLTGSIAAAYIRGVQSSGVGTSAKHFAVNSQETDRTSVDQRLSQRAARELYLRGFEIAVREGQPWTVMSSYNKVNGLYSMGSHDLLTKVLRDDWGFGGIVMTDWIGIRHDLPTISEVQAGNDLLEPGQPAQVSQIVEAVKGGQLDMADVDRNVRRMLEYIVKTPSFKRYAATGRPDLKAHAATTRQAASEGIVLLKNGPWPDTPSGDATPRPTLPLAAAGSRGLPGGKVVKTVALFGVCSYHLLAGGTGSGCVHTPYVVDMVEGLANAGISTSQTLTDIYRRYVDYARLKFQAERQPWRWFQTEAMGQQKYPEITFSRMAIGNEAAHADAAIVTIGRQAGEGEDRDAETEFNLTADEHRMLADVCQLFHAAGKPVIVVINSGSVVETASWRGLPDAIVCVWQPGEEGGNSVADILTGRVNPSGKLPMTWPVSVYDHPSTRDFPGGSDRYGSQSGNRVTHHSEDIYVGYRFFDTFGREVAYPFGYGLSYTSFRYSAPRVRVGSHEAVVSVTVTNVGSVAGKETAQVYVTAPRGRIAKPAHELKAFAKTRLLQPGESQTLTMHIPVRLLASFDEAGSQWLTEAGQYLFCIGASSRDIRHSVTATVEQYTEQVSNALRRD